MDLQVCNKKWMDFKCDLKAEHFDPLKPIEQIQGNIPKGVEATQWRILVNGWYTEQSQISTLELNQHNNYEILLHI